MFMMYFIHNFLTNTIRPLLRPSSGWCYRYTNTTRIPRRLHITYTLH